MSYRSFVLLILRERFKSMLSLSFCDSEYIILLASSATGTRELQVC